MKIVYFHQHFSPPNAFGNNRSLDLAKYWVSQGHKVTIVCGSGNFKDVLPFYRPYKTLYIDDIEIVRLNVGYSHFSNFKKRVYSFLKYFMYSFLLSTKYRKADYIYASSTPLTVGIIGVIVKKLLHKKLVFETVDLWPDVPVQMGILRNRFLVKFLFRMEKWIYRNSDLIVTLSEGMKEAVVSKQIHASKVIVAHNGTDVHHFRPCKDRVKAKEGLGLPAHSFVVVYAGTIGLANGVTFMIDIAKMSEGHSHIPLIFLLVGDGNRKTEVMEYSKRLRVKNISFIDPVSKKDVGKYLDAADVGFVCFASYPILNTNSANKFFDYLASGLPVVINYEGWQKEYLEKYICGFSAKSPEEAFYFLKNLAEDPQRALRLGENARRLALELFDRKFIAEKVIKAIENL